MNDMNIQMLMAMVMPLVMSLQADNAPQGKTAPAMPQGQAAPTQPVIIQPQSSPQ